MCALMSCVCRALRSRLAVLPAPRALTHTRGFSRFDFHYVYFIFFVIDAIFMFMILKRSFVPTIARTHNPEPTHIFVAHISSCAAHLSRPCAAERDQREQSAQRESADRDRAGGQDERPLLLNSSVS